MGHCFLSMSAFLKTPSAAAWWGACLNQRIFLTSTPRGFVLTRVPDGSDAHGDQTNSRKQAAWASPHTLLPVQPLPVPCQPWADRQLLQGGRGLCGCFHRQRCPRPGNTGMAFEEQVQSTLGGEEKGPSCRR